MTTLFQNIQMGEFFRSDYDGKDGPVYQRIPKQLGERGWDRSATEIAVNTDNGRMAGFGPSSPVIRCARPDSPRRELIEANVVKLVERDYEFGIGGIAQADDPYHDWAQYQPTGEKRTKLTGTPKPHNGGGQLWESCPRCGTEPVHVHCGYCDKHCQC
jgi:hypothetical protein